MVPTVKLTAHLSDGSTRPTVTDDNLIISLTPSNGLTYVATDASNGRIEGSVVAGTDVTIEVSRNVGDAVQLLGSASFQWPVSSSSEEGPELASVSVEVTFN